MEADNRKVGEDDFPFGNLPSTSMIVGKASSRGRFTSRVCFRPELQALPLGSRHVGPSVMESKRV